MTFKKILMLFFAFLLVVANGLIVLDVEATTRSAFSLIKVPMSWCAVEGSQATDRSIGIPNNLAPDAAEDKALDDKLWRRHERVSENLYINDAGITFRSAINSHSKLNFPVISDLDKKIGKVGDVLRSEDKIELKKAVRNCYSNWESLSRNTGSVNGITSVNVRQIVNEGGSPHGVIGWGGWAENMDVTSTSKIPFQGFVVVTDNYYLYKNDPFDLLLAHELGHALKLTHRNSENALMNPYLSDNNGDGIYDTSNINSAEIQTLRSTALKVPGVENSFGLTSNAQIIKGSEISSQRIDLIQENPSLSDTEDISAIKATLSRDQDVSIFGHHLLGLFKNDSSSAYWTYVDLDNNKATGLPINLFKVNGFPESKFAGADLILEARVENGTNISGNGWKVVSGKLQMIDPIYLDFNIQTIMSSYYLLEGSNIRSTPPVPVNNIVNVFVDNRLGVLSAHKPFNVQAVVDTNNTTKDKLDQTPEEIGKRYELIEYPYPQCGAGTDVVPGESVTISANGLSPNSQIHGLIGGASDVIFKGNTNGTGGGEFDFPIPANISKGLHLVTVGVDNTAFTADCVVNVVEKNITDVGDRPIPGPDPQFDSCQDGAIQHWDKIVFKITNAELANSLGLPANSELDIKVLDNPSKVMDLKQQVFDYLGLRSQDASSQYIDILDVEYATSCVVEEYMRED